MNPRFLQNLNISFQALTEEQQFLKVESAKKDSFKTKHYEEKDTIIEEIKKRLQEAHRDLASVNNEKFFIQRLCNDLKVALKSYANQNQVKIIENYLLLLFFGKTLSHFFFCIGFEGKA